MQDTDNHKLALIIVIICIGAALILYMIVSNFNKKIIEGRLKNFYSMINQAVKLSETSYGDSKYWLFTTPSSDSDAMEDWWNTYFATNIKTLKTEQEGEELWVYLKDQTKLRLYNYYDEAAAETCLYLYFYPYSNNLTNINGKDYFTFFISSAADNGATDIAPYKLEWSGLEKDLRVGTYGCNKKNTDLGHYCLALIQYYDWKIPADYPYKF